MRDGLESLKKTFVIANRSLGEAISGVTNGDSNGSIALSEIASLKCQRAMTPLSWKKTRGPAVNHAGPRLIDFPLDLGL